MSLSEIIALVTALYGMGEMILFFFLFSRSGIAVGIVAAIVVPTSLVACYFLATEVHWGLGLATALVLTAVKVRGFRTVTAGTIKTPSP